MTDTKNTKRVILEVTNNQGYAADQVPTSVTLGDLLEEIQHAIELHGEDAVVCTQDTGNRYGANFGAIYANIEIVLGSIGRT